MSEEKRTFWGLIQRRQCLVPTWRGWTALVLILGLSMTILVRQAHPFLAVTDSHPGGALVVEGWAPDYALKEAIQEFDHHKYSRVYVTGGPIEFGALLFKYGSYAELGAVRLAQFGLSTNAIQAVPAPFVRQDRTYTSAVSLRRWLDAHHLAPTTLNVLTEGAHARRSRLLFEEAFGRQVTIGIIAIPPLDYDPARWWHSSQGVRSIIGEALAYGYARFFFWPPHQS